MISSDPVASTYLDLGNCGTYIEVYSSEHGPQLVVRSSSYGSMKSEQKFYISKETITVLKEMFEQAESVDYEEEHNHALKTSEEKFRWRNSPGGQAFNRVYSLGCDSDAAKAAEFIATAIDMKSKSVLDADIRLMLIDAIDQLIGTATSAAVKAIRNTFKDYADKSIGHVMSTFLTEDSELLNEIDDKINSEIPLVVDDILSKTISSNESEIVTAIADGTKRLVDESTKIMKRLAMSSKDMSKMIDEAHQWISIGSEIAYSHIDKYTRLAIEDPSNEERESAVHAGTGVIDRG